MFALRWPSPISQITRHAAYSARRPTTFNTQPLFRHSLCTATPTYTPRASSFLRSYRLALAASLPIVALGFTTRQKPIQCASDRAYAQLPNANGSISTGEPAPAESIVNLRDLSFGTVSGICVGIFVKKGLKAVAFALGGIFIFLQYMSSRSLIQVNWSSITSSYDSFITKRAGPSAAQGGNRITGLGNWFIDFVGADIQSRATFVAGILLGFRLG